VSDEWSRNKTRRRPAGCLPWYWRSSCRVAEWLVRPELRIGGLLSRSVSRRGGLSRGVGRGRRLGRRISGGRGGIASRSDRWSGGSCGYRSRSRFAAADRRDSQAGQSRQSKQFTHGFFLKCKPVNKIRTTGQSRDLVNIKPLDPSTVSSIPVGRKQPANGSKVAGAGLSIREAARPRAGCPIRAGSVSSAAG
jgi:hypothetical protein